MEMYETVKSIGSGSFGQVYLSRNKREDKLYVIKRIKTRDISDKDREAIENEVIQIKNSKINLFKIQIIRMLINSRFVCFKNYATQISSPTKTAI